MDTDTAVYIMGHDDMLEKIAGCIQNPKPILFSVDGADWNRDFTPWPAEAVWKGQEPFSGGADHFLRELTEQIVAAEQGMRIRRRILAGYSLSALFAVWSVFRDSPFTEIISASGSLWYDGFVQFAKENQFVTPPDRIYFSLGNREANAKDERMSKVEVSTEEICDIFRKRNIDTFFEYNEGGHFRDVPERIAKGIEHILGGIME